MWKTRREDEKPFTSPTPQPPAPVVPAPSAYQPRTLEIPKVDNHRSDVAHIGKSVIIKGELTGSEDLYLDGEVEGSIDLREHSLVIGPNGSVRANVFAKDVVIQGKVDGNVSGVEKVELKKSAMLNGDISTQRIVIEDGAYFKGSIDIRKGEPKSKSEAPHHAAQATATAVSSLFNGSASTASAGAEKK